MDSLFTGSVQSWLAVVATTLSPLIALMVGFEGADWFLRRRARSDGRSCAIEGSRGNDD
jgi:hypothetical protein